MGKTSGKFFHKIIGNQKVPLKSAVAVMAENDGKDVVEENTEIHQPVNTAKKEPKAKLPPIFDKNMIWLVAGILSLIVFVFLGGKLIFLNKTVTENQQVSPEAVSSEIIVAGKVASSANVLINADVNGVVGRIFVKKGDRVKLGQKIADLIPDQEDRKKNDQALSEYLVVKKKLESAQETEKSLQGEYLATHKRFMEGAVASNLPSSDPVYIQQKTEMDNAESQYKKQQSTVLGLQRTASNLWQNYEQGLFSINAPAAGTIGEIFLVQGEGIPKKAVLIKTEDETTLVFNITESDFSKIQTNDKVEITFKDYPEKIFIGKVRKIEQNELTAVLDQHEESFTVDMPASAKIITD